MPFNFLDLEDIDADYSRNVDRAVRVASLFQAYASPENLGPHFLSSDPDPYAFYIQRVRFNGIAEGSLASAQTLVSNLAAHCRQGLAAEV